MKKFRLEDYEGKCAMHVNTEEEYDAFSKFLYKNGKTWCDGYTYLESNHWEIYKSEFCFEFSDGTYSPLDFYKSNGYTILEFSDFDWEKKEMKEFKVGDWVKGKEGNFFDNKVLQIVNIVNDNLVFANHEGCLKSYCAELVCEFTKNQEVEVSSDGKFYNSIWGKFYEYKSDLKKPFLVISKNGDITNWKYCRAVQPKYKPYEKLDVDWLGKKVIFKSESDVSECSKIIGFYIHNNSFKVNFNTMMSRSLKQCFEDIEWIDEDGNRTPFGEEI